jgi:hypothetical protein
LWDDAGFRKIFTNRTLGTRNPMSNAYKLAFKVLLSIKGGIPYKYSDGLFEEVEPYLNKKDVIGSGLVGGRRIMGGITMGGRRRGGILVGGSKGASTWIDTVKRYAQEHPGPQSYKKALIALKGTKLKQDDEGYYYG